jgi:cytidyltransferase-like protein
MKRVFVSGAFDDSRSKQLRFLQEAARIGPLTLVLWPDEAIERLRGMAPMMSLAERRYYFEACKFVGKVVEAPKSLDPDTLEAGSGSWPSVWVVTSFPVCNHFESVNLAKISWCQTRGMEIHEILPEELAGFPYDIPPIDAPRPVGIKRVVVTGCYDWLHTGHIRFFEETASYGELNVVIGSDSNVRLLKGEGHPKFPEEERRFVVGAFRNVARCLVSTGSGWMDAEPEIRALKADRYVVNEDGDKDDKRSFCEKNGIEYIVLKRVPKEGLPYRTSTRLRGY